MLLELRPFSYPYQHRPSVNLKWNIDQIKVRNLLVCLGLGTRNLLFHWQESLPSSSISSSDSTLRVLFPNVLNFFFFARALFLASSMYLETDLFFTMTQASYYSDLLSSSVVLSSQRIASSEINILWNEGLKMPQSWFFVLFILVLINDS